MKKRILSAIALALVASACSSGTETAEPVAATTTAVATTEAPTTTVAPTTTTTVPPTTTTTLSPEAIAQAELEADAKLIKTLFRRFSDSWHAGTEQASEYMADNTYPALLCTTGSALVGFADVADGYTEEHIVDGDSIERDDGWTLPIGPSKGEPIDGRVYIFTDEITYSSPGLTSSNERAEVHAAIVDGEAYFFFACWPDEYNE